MPIRSPEMPSAALRGAVLHNGERPNPGAGGSVEGRPHHYSTSSLHKLRRFNTLILILRLVSLCFSLAASIFMGMNIHTPTPKWYHYDAFRYVVGANGMVCIYSGVEIGLVMWEVLKGSSVMPEVVQVWFDYGHDQVLAYVLMWATSAGTAEAQRVRKGGRCKEEEGVVCVQAEIAIALGYASLLFVAGVCLLSGFRLSSFLITHSRSHI